MPDGVFGVVCHEKRFITVAQPLAVAFKHYATINKAALAAMQSVGSNRV